uniref:rap guanine nucleotide exchange factor 4-like n=1 Tax=Myxine glutinosa TaxID=7769 RepID=UPI00358EC7C2
MPLKKLCPALMGHYHAKSAVQGSEQEKADYALGTKRRVVQLVLQWSALHSELLKEDTMATALLEDLYVSVTDDVRNFPGLQEDKIKLEKLKDKVFHNESSDRSYQRKNRLLRQFSIGEDHLQKCQPIRGVDESK